MAEHIHQGARRDLMEPIRHETNLGDQILKQHGHCNGQQFGEIPNITRRKR